MHRRVLLVLLAFAILASAAAEAQAQRVGLETGVTPNGRKLDPVGKLTELGAFPTGGALTPDGDHYWAVDAGRGQNFIRIIDSAEGNIVQTCRSPAARSASPSLPTASAPTSPGSSRRARSLPTRRASAVT